MLLAPWEKTYALISICQYGNVWSSGASQRGRDRPSRATGRAHLLAESREHREAVEAGAKLRHPNGRKVVPLSLSSIKSILDGYAAVLGEAVKDKYRPDNPGRGERMQVEVPKPERSFLEADELAALLDAARDQDIGLSDLAELSVAGGESPDRVARLAASGRRPAQIAAELSLSRATVTYHLRRLGIDLGRG